MSIRTLARGILAPDLDAGLAETRPAIAHRLADVRAAAGTIDTVAAERAGRLPERALDDLFQAGLFTLTVPAAQGGSGVTLLEFCRAVAMVAEHDAALAVTAVPHLANGVLSVARFGDAGQRDEVLGGIVRRRALIAFALTEAHTGSDVASHRSRLTRHAGALRLDGAKTWITNVPLASHVVVVAKCPELSPIKEGSAFALVRPDDAGFGVGRLWQKLAVNASPTVDLYLDAVPLPESRLVGRPGAAMAQFGEVVIWGRLGAAAAACGLLSRAAGWASLVAQRDPAAVRLALALQRRELLARATLEISAARCSAGEGGDRETTTALCKMFCTRSARQAAQAVWAFAVEHLRRAPPLLAQSVLEASVFQVLEGPNELIGHRAAVDLLGGLRRPDPAPLPEASSAPPAVARLAAAFAGWLAAVGESPEPLSAAPLQQVADLACAAWAGACGAAWERSSAIPAGARRRLDDAVGAFCGAALHLFHRRMSDAVGRSREEEY